MERRGWRLEQVLSIQEEPGAVITEKGMMRSFICNALFSRALQEFTVWVPDARLPKLLADPRLRRIVKKVS